MEEVRLPLDWELWVVEHLLFSAHREGLADALVARGVERRAAMEQVDAVLASAQFERLRARLAEATLASRLERLQRELLPPIEAIDVVDDLDAETLHKEHWIPSRPIKISRCAPRLKALEWTLADLAERYGDVEIDVNVDRGRATSSRDVEQYQAPMTLRAFVERALGDETDDLYVVSRNGLLCVEGLAPLWDDLAPLPAFVGPVRRPRGVSLWAGPKGTRTRPHFDPHNVLLLQVEGEKRVRLSPRLSPKMASRFEGYYLVGDLDPAIDPIFEVRLSAGEALFIPAAWIHEVIALAPSMTLSFVSFPWPNHFHFLGPPGSDD
ncbi:MAG: cupin-like domain-containing protein [Polyangiaceae bacterium]